MIEQPLSAPTAERSMLCAAALDEPVSMLQAAMDKERSELLEQVERLEHEQRTLRIRDSGAIDEFGRKVERLRERVAEFKLLSGDSVDTD